MPIAAQRGSAATLVVCSLFLGVAALVAADLHSSLLSINGKWETNPFITVLAAHIGVRAALVAVKVTDLILLASLYALWRRWKANAVFTLVLSITAIEYLPIVLENYFR